MSGIIYGHIKSWGPTLRNSDLILKICLLAAILKQVTKMYASNQIANPITRNLDKNSNQVLAFKYLNIMCMQHINSFGCTVPIASIFCGNFSFCCFFFLIFLETVLYNSITPSSISKNSYRK